MLESIKELFMGLIEPILALINLVITFISDIVYIVKLLGVFTINLPSYFSWLPTPCLTLILTAFSIVVLYKIMGREG